MSQATPPPPPPKKKKKKKKSGSKGGHIHDICVPIFSKRGYFWPLYTKLHTYIPNYQSPELSIKGCIFPQNFLRNCPRLTKLVGYTMNYVAPYVCVSVCLSVLKINEKCYFSVISWRYNYNHLFVLSDRAWCKASKLLHRILKLGMQV